MPSVDANVIESGIESTLAKFFLSLQLPKEYGGRGYTKEEARDYIYNFLYNVASTQYTSEEVEEQEEPENPDIRDL